MHLCGVGGLTMAFESLHNLIKHQVSIPSGYSGRLSDIHLDVTSILTSDMLDDYLWDNDKLQSQLDNLPIVLNIGIEPSFKFYIVSVGILLNIFAFGFCKKFFGVDWVLFVFSLIILLFGLCLSFYIIPKYFKLTREKKKIFIYQDHLIIQENTIRGDVQDEMRIDFCDIYQVACEEVPFFSNTYLTANTPRESSVDSYYAVNVYYLTYSVDGLYYNKNVLELCWADMEEDMMIEYATPLKNLLENYWHINGKDNLPKVNFIKQK